MADEIENIKTALEKLDAMRSGILELYVNELMKWDQVNGNPEAAMRAGVLHDLDKHITNLMLEVKRIEVVREGW